jgi:hypothetical protein
MTNPNILVIGHGRHGKDTVCEILRDQFNYSFESSSQFCNKLFVFDQLKDKYGYANKEECYADRHNHRAEWYDAISNYNVPNAARLGIELFKEHNVYCGLRNKKEFFAMKNSNVFQYAIWVDRSEHLPLEPSSSMNLEQWMADFTIDNNSGIKELEFNIQQLVHNLHAQQDPALWLSY